MAEREAGRPEGPTAAGPRPPSPDAGRGRSVALPWRLAVMLFPPSFRRRFGADLGRVLQRTFRERWSERRAAGRAALAASVLLSITRDATVEWVSTLLRGGRHRDLIPRASSMETLLIDLRFAVRSLRRSPGVTAAVLITLALATGANTAVYSVLSATVLRELPFHQPDRLAYLWGSALKPDNVGLWRTRPRAFESVEPVAIGRTVLRHPDGARFLTALGVTEGFVSTLGISPVGGRAIAADEVASGSPVVLIRDDLAIELYGSVEGAVGKPLDTDDGAPTIVGVLPGAATRAFRYPMTEVWLPLAAEPRRYSLVARLRAGVDLAAARAELETIIEAEGLPPAQVGPTIAVESLREMVVGFGRPVIQLLYAAVAIVLLIAVANVSHLFLVRGLGRQRELTVRSAIGAGRGRLLRLLLIEGLLVSLVASALGVLLAAWLTPILLRHAPMALQRADDVGIDLNVLAYTCGVAVVAGVLFGLLPGLLVRPAGLTEGLRDGARSGERRAHRRARAAFAVAEVALALVLVAGAGLLLRTFATLRPISPGFEAVDKIVFELRLPESRYPTAEDHVAAYGRIRDTLEGLPEARETAMVSDLPFSMSSIVVDMFVGERQVSGPGGWMHLRIATPNYHDMLAIPVLRGRALTDRDTIDSPEVAVVNETAARRLAPEGEVLGTVVRSDYPGPVSEFTVVGVVRDTRVSPTDHRPRAEMFVPFAQVPSSRMSILVQSAPGAAALGTEVRQTIASIDPALPLERLRTFEELLFKSIGTMRFNATLMTAFAALALSLAALGIYGVLSHSVRTRVHEIGVRIALGARGADVLRLVIRQGAVVIVLGLGTGWLLAWLASGTIESQLYGVTRADPMMLVAVSAFLALVAGGAAWIPARRATRVDPVDSLRVD